MTVEQLIKRLESLPQKAEVMRFNGVNSLGDGGDEYKPFTDKHIQFDELIVVIY